MNNKLSFVLLTRHSDKELTNYLQRQAEAGWWLYKVRGNRFYFKRRPYEGKRICAYSFSSTDPDTPTELQLSHFLTSVRKKGWDLICVSGPENIFDSRRHAFLYEEKKGAMIPECESFERDGANKRKVRKTVANFLVCVMFQIFLLLALKSDLMRIVSNSGYLVFSFLFAIALIVGLCLSLISLVFTFRDRKKDVSSYYRLVDYSTQFINIVLIAAILLLLVDGIWGDPSSRGERVKINNSSVRIYSDELLIDLDELGIEETSSYRSKRRKGSESFIGASYTYCFDELIGTEGYELYFISYTIFESPSDVITKAVMNQVIDFRAVDDSDRARELNVDRALVGKKAMLLRRGNNFILIRSGFELTEKQQEKLSSLLP
ncbi:MAG: hypothetical protein K6G51_04485 [Sphaerochaetaceae bacterium]|nr:hypothetical protein [Sphaerochaetaceae bacterium]